MVPVLEAGVNAVADADKPSFVLAARPSLPPAAPEGPLLMLTQFVQFYENHTGAADNKNRTSAALSAPAPDDQARGHPR